jgi:hypothetical protein
MFPVSIGAALASIPLWSPMLAFIGFTAIAVILGVILWADNDRKKNWPGPDSWFAILSEDREQRFNLKSIQWSMDEQEEGQTFYLDISGSPQRPRVIRGFKFLQGLQHQLEYPEEWELTVTNERFIPIEGYDKVRQREKRPSGGIEVLFDKPTAVTTILITCVVPRSGRKWTVSGIQIKDSYLTGIWEKDVRFPDYI